VRIYLDVSCLNRPFDDQSQRRVRLESEAVTQILGEIEKGTWQHLSSEMATIEVDEISDRVRRRRVRLLLPPRKAMLKLSGDVFDRSVFLESLGFKPADAVHLAAAESLECDVLLSCDDRFCRRARRHEAELSVRVLNPIEWLKEIGHEADPG
jgi:predicted nucleic acid-binding protein